MTGSLFESPAFHFLKIMRGPSRVRYAYAITGALLLGGTAIAITSPNVGAQTAQNEGLQAAAPAGAPASLADMVEKLQPAVVNISTKQRVAVQNPFAGTPFGDLFGQAPGDLQPVDGVDPAEVRGDVTRLVALQRPDEVPFETPVGQLRYLVDSFLHVAFAEGALPRCDSLAHTGGGPCLGNGEQAHGPVRSPGHNTGGGNACTHSLQVGGD